jgi:hypothetical protein
VTAIVNAGGAELADVDALHARALRHLEVERAGPFDRHFPALALHIDDAGQPGVEHEGALRMGPLERQQHLVAARRRIGERQEHHVVLDVTRLE